MKSNKLPIEIVFSKLLKEQIFTFMEDYPEEFEPILRLSFTDKKPICWRAAWAIQHFMTKDDPRIKPYVDTLLDIIPKKEDGHQRELLKILANMNLDDDRQSILYDECVTIWEAVKKKPGTRYFAFQQMMKMVEKYPELIQEIRAVTQPQHINTLSPGVKQGVLKMLTKFERDHI